jgi:hypothetical protein
LRAAIATGLPCFPCGPNKRPAIPGPGGHKHATSDPAALCELWRRFPGPLVGVPTGEASGLSVFDYDGQRHSEARAWLAAYRVQLPTTRIHRTRSGDLHFLFEHAPGVRNSQGRLAKGVDTRGDGGYAIWWPAAGCPVACDSPLAPWPQWLLQALRPRSAPRSQLPTEPLDQRRFEGVLRKVKFAPESQRNSSLFWGACRLGEAVTLGEIAAAVAVTALMRAAVATGLPEREARRTIESAFRTTSK